MLSYIGERKGVSAWSGIGAGLQCTATRGSSSGVRLHPACRSHRPGRGVNPSSLSCLGCGLASALHQGCKLNHLGAASLPAHRLFPPSLLKEKRKDWPNSLGTCPLCLGIGCALRQHECMHKQQGHGDLGMALQRGGNGYAVTEAGDSAVGRHDAGPITPLCTLSYRT